MKALIGKWGKSDAVRLPKEITEALGLKAGDEVDLTVEGGKVTVSPAPKLYDPDGLFEALKGQEPPELIDWGPPVGDESW